MGVAKLHCLLIDRGGFEILGGVFAECSIGIPTETFDGLPSCCEFYTCPIAVFEITSIL